MHAAAQDSLRFALSDRIGDAEVGPELIPLHLLGDFQRDVTDFLRGSSKEIDPAAMVVSVETGSFALVVHGLLGAVTLWQDVATLASNGSLSEIDGRRAAVIERWQTTARNSPHRRYAVSDSLHHLRVVVDVHSAYSHEEQVWVSVERYVSGRVIDIGGKSKPNVHLELPDGRVLMIAAPRELLAQEERNRVYQHALLHVTMDENLVTGAVRNYRLLGFESENSTYDELEFQEMVRLGTLAWSDVANATEWVEDLRDGRA